MKRLSKQTVTPLLMISSIMLLIVLQIFWLRGAYRGAKSDLRKETNQLFRTTIFALHDSAVQKNIIPINRADSVMAMMHKKTFQWQDSVSMLKFTTVDTVLTDGQINIVREKEKATRIEIISSIEQSDSIKGLIKPLVKKIQMNKEPMTFMVRLSGDSLRVDTIKVYFGKALAEAGIDAHFRVHAFRGPRLPVPGFPTDEIQADLVSDIVPLSPVNRYAASFNGINGYLIRKISPEILFSLFLTILTCAAFAVLYQNLRSQQKLMKMKNDFISNITHELKTPVATVSVALEALKNFRALDDPKRTAEYLDIAQSELSRLTLMTDKILKTAVYEDKGVDLKVEYFDFDGLIQQVLASMKLVFEKRRTKLSYTKEGTDFFIEGSHSHLTHVLYNLVDNALKYSPPESAVSVQLQESGDLFELTVQDNGIGIPDEYQSKIFEKFFRVPTGDVHNTKGYGLGLSYVASVVRSHGGTIDVKSQRDEGSSFIIKLPKKAATS